LSAGGRGIFLVTLDFSFGEIPRGSGTGDDDFKNFNSMVQPFARFVVGRSVGIGELDTDFAVLVSVFLAVVVYLWGWVFKTVCRGNVCSFGGAGGGDLAVLSNLVIVLVGL
jgi:hypothetical protein